MGAICSAYDFAGTSDRMIAKFIPEVTGEPSDLDGKNQSESPRLKASALPTRLVFLFLDFNLKKNVGGKENPT